MTVRDDLLRILEHTDGALLDVMYPGDLSLDEIASTLFWLHRREIADEVAGFGGGRALADLIYPEERR